jgi:hypothetical protein
VIVPVLSDAITVALPNVSRHSNYLIYTFFAPNYFIILFYIMLLSVCYKFN